MFDQVLFQHRPDSIKRKTKRKINQLNGRKTEKSHTLLSRFDDDVDKTILYNDNVINNDIINIKINIIGLLRRDKTIVSL